MIMEFDSKKPTIGEAVFVAENASVIGEVSLAKNCSIWFGAVLRGDEALISIDEASNVQDNATIHCDAGIPTVIGKHVTIGHNAIIHSCIIEDCVVIGMGAIILNGAKIGKGSVIAAGAVVTGNTVIPPYSMAAGAPAVIKKTYGEEIETKNKANAIEYVRLASKF